MAAVCVRDAAADNRPNDRRDAAEEDNRPNNRRDVAEAVCVPNDLHAAAGRIDDDLQILSTLFLLFLPPARRSSAQNLTRRKSAEQSSPSKIFSSESLP